MKYPQLVSMPSEVSDWLEEQLESRGIDSVVYTRYILSLLHRDPVDVVYPDQDLQLTQPNKEVRRSGGGRKRFRRSTERWGHAHADLEQLKRSAAIECLMSASDQKCGMESLVDELCEKLKEIKSDSTINLEQTASTSRKEHNNKSPQDLAKQYYAAFPPLCRKSGSPTNLITLIPKWFGSPKKKGSRKHNRSSSCEEKLHCKVEFDNMKARNLGKQKFSYFSRNKKDLGFSRSVAKSMERSESMNDWDLYMFNNNSKISSNWPQAAVGSKEFSSLKKVAQDYPTPEEVEENHDTNMYEDLPVDIFDFLDSPDPTNYTIEMMNLANMRDTGNKNFIKYGTNIKSSIWSSDIAMDDTSMYDNAYNSALLTGPEDMFEFSSKSVDKTWSKSEIDNQTNYFMETWDKAGSSGKSSNLWSILPEKFEKWSEAECADDDFNLMESFMKLNHSKYSLFSEISRPFRVPFSVTVGSKSEATVKKKDVGKEEENLLTSGRSHFKPISDAVKNESEEAQYADGTTFVIPSNLDVPDYKRSESGALYLDAEFGPPKKYFELPASDDLPFTLKFAISKNDKACQTDGAGVKSENDDVAVVEKMHDDAEYEFYFPGDLDFLDDDDYCPQSTRPDSVMAEIIWKSDTKKCEKCNKKSEIGNLGKIGGIGSVWQDKQSLQDIWNGGEVCPECLDLNMGNPIPNRNKLREDISQDGEQLLSDLSTLQRTYMEQLPVTEVEQLPVTELSYDISELITGPKERRRFGRLRLPAIGSLHRGSWSIASHVKEDHLIQMTVPALRSVTL